MGPFCPQNAADSRPRRPWPYHTRAKPTDPDASTDSRPGNTLVKEGPRPAPGGSRRHLNLLALSARDPQRTPPSLSPHPGPSVLRTTRPATPAVPPPRGLSALTRSLTVARAGPDPDSSTDPRLENTLVNHRARVVGPFRAIKDIFGFRKVRYRGCIRTRSGASYSAP